MERVFDALKNFILEKVNELLPLYEDERARLPPFTDKTILFGAVDPVRNTQEAVCSVYPESIEEAADDIDGEDAYTASCIVSFLCRQAPYEELMARACRYALCFKRAVQTDWTLCNRARNAEVSRINSFPDCGITEKQATACEIEMTITLTEEKEENGS